MWRRVGKDESRRYSRRTRRGETRRGETRRDETRRGVQAAAATVAATAAAAAASSERTASARHSPLAQSEWMACESVDIERCHLQRGFERAAFCAPSFGCWVARLRARSPRRSFAGRSPLSPQWARRRRRRRRRRSVRARRGGGGGGNATAASSAESCRRHVDATRPAFANLVEAMSAVAQRASIKRSWHLGTTGETRGECRCSRPLAPSSPPPPSSPPLPAVASLRRLRSPTRRAQPLKTWRRSSGERARWRRWRRWRLRTRARECVRRLSSGGHHHRRHRRHRRRRRRLSARFCCAQPHDARAHSTTNVDHDDQDDARRVRVCPRLAAHQKSRLQAFVSKKASCKLHV